jgi:two-component system CheB/CheR fusion protein
MEIERRQHPTSREEDLKKILSLLRGLTGVDFSHYKLSTINRRIARRMVLHKFQKLSQYVQKLQQNPAEVEALFHDILINVTSFFREPEAFQVLKKKVFPKLVKNKPAEAPIRVWVPGCSTGEEVYSLAICLSEFLEHARLQSPVQMFGTDLSEAAIAKARAGTYLSSIALDVPPERLRRYFLKTEDNYQIAKTIRDLCVFSRQIVTQDPPFSHIDLISCRNVLIYMDAGLQNKLVPIFHYALKPTGFLFLGSAETISGFSDLFAPLDKKNRIYAKKTQLWSKN